MANGCIIAPFANFAFLQTSEVMAIWRGFRIDAQAVKTCGGCADPATPFGATLIASRN